jgi:Zn-finger nucleic acid-binding protein
VSSALLVCKQCGGAWIDVATSKRLVQGLLFDVELFVANHVWQLASAKVDAADASPYRKRLRDDEEQRACPVCRSVMQRCRISEADAVIDACPAHGTWFDGDELVRVSSWFSTGAPRAAAELDREAQAAEFGRDKDGFRHALAHLAQKYADHYKL